MNTAQMLVLDLLGGAGGGVAPVTDITMTHTTASPAVTRTIPRITTTASDVVVAWGDGNETTLSSGTNNNVAHEYADAGEYIIRIQNSMETISWLDVTTMGLTAMELPDTLTALVEFYFNANSIAEMRIPDTLTALELVRASANSMTVFEVPVLPKLRQLRAFSCSLSTATIDAIINTAYESRASYTYASTIELNFGGTNAAPSGVYQDVCPPTTVLERVYQMENDNCAEGINLWDVIYVNP